jgi:hypothetical protein
VGRGGGDGGRPGVNVIFCKNFLDLICVDMCVCVLSIMVTKVIEYVTTVRVRNDSTSALQCVIIMIFHS